MGSDGSGAADVLQRRRIVTAFQLEPVLTAGRAILLGPGAQRGKSANIFGRQRASAIVAF